MGATKKTDNSYAADKIAMRVNHSPWPSDRPLRVLDCFGGKGIVWRGVERLSGKNVDRDCIEERHDLSDFHFHGDNLKVMPSLALLNYDVIDVDAYGVPAEQLKIILDSKFKGVVFVTLIQTMQGAIPKIIIEDLGIPLAVIEKAPSLIARRGWEYSKEWLNLHGVAKIIHRSKGRKHYFCFRLSDVA